MTHSLSLFRRALLGSATLAALCAGAALAQDTVDQRLQDFRASGITEIPADEALLTGKDDLVLLQERKFFSVNANLRSTFTNNAYLSNQVRKSDLVTDGSLTGRFATRIDQTYDVYAEAGVLASRYANQHGLGYNGITAGIGGEAPVGKLRVGMQYGYTTAFEKGGFSDQLVGLHDIVGYANYPISLGNDTALVPQLALDRTLGNPSDYDAWTVRGSVSVVHRLKANLIGVAGVDLAYKDYDDYFESVIGESREDKTAGVSASLRWTPLDAVQLAAGVQATYNNSSVRANDYTMLSVTPSVQLKVSF